MSADPSVDPNVDPSVDPNVNPIPAGYHTVTPYLIAEDAAAAMAFYVAGLGATELYRLTLPDGTIAHSELIIGDSRIMLADAKMAQLGGAPGEKLPVSFMVYVPDSDAAFDRAVKAGATSLRPVADQFYGDRTGTFRDPFGHMWSVGTHIKDMSPEEMQKAMESMGG